MAELLLYYADSQRGYEVGDIVHAAADGTAWGGMECLESFLVVRVPLAADDAQALCCPLIRDASTGIWQPSYVQAGEPPQWEVVSPCRYALDINAAFAAAGVEPDDFGRMYLADWLVYDVPATITDKAA